MTSNNFINGFQPLHAVYAAEKFFNNLKRRGCRFYVFDGDLCVPPSATDPESYFLTRTILIKHLERNTEVSENGNLRFRFSDMDSIVYEWCLKGQAVCSFLSLDGHVCFGAEDEKQAKR